MTEPWGHKVTMHIYVHGDQLAALEISNRILDSADWDDPRITFTGVSLSEVQDEPYDQVAT